MIQGHSFELELFVLPIHGPDIVLGLDWLRSLRRVMSDYVAGTLEFMSGSKQIALKSCLVSLGRSPCARSQR